VCFWLEPTDRVRRYLRRHAGRDARLPDGRQCTANKDGEHEAWAQIEDTEAVWSEPDGTVGTPKSVKTGDPAEFIGDRRWPTSCECGYRFREDDERQVITALIYRRTDSGEEMTLREAPPGALWDAWWLHGARTGTAEYGGPDGRVIMVKTPAGPWVVDGPPADRPEQKWTRTGEPPRITVRPSIRIGSPVRYCAFLTNGILQAFPLTVDAAQEAAVNASVETAIPFSVVQVRAGAYVVMETNVASRHHLRILASYTGNAQQAGNPEPWPHSAGRRPPVPHWLSGVISRIAHPRAGLGRLILGPRGPFRSTAGR
jgi:hypothetical protein